jgi:hypothetical protein
MKPKHAQIISEWKRDEIRRSALTSKPLGSGDKQKRRANCVLATYVNSGELVRLEAINVLGDFLDNLDFFQGLDCHYLIFK